LALQNEMTELMDTLEAVTLESEQRCADLERAETRIQELEASSKLAPGAGGAQGSSDSGEEVLRLKDALRRLQAVHVSEKQASAAALAALTDRVQTADEERSSLDEARAEVLRLETRVLELEEEAQELAQQVDDASGFADMVETLSASNEELTARATRLEEQTADLESAVDLGEQIDAGQRQEIASLRAEVDTRGLRLTQALQSLDVMAARCDSQSKKCEAMKSAMDALRQEKDALCSQLSEGELELHRTAGHQADWFQQKRELAAAHQRASQAQQELAATHGELLLTRAQVTRLRALLEPSSCAGRAPHAGRLALLDVPLRRPPQTGDDASTVGEAHLRRETALFVAEAAVSSSLQRGIELYRKLQHILQEEGGGESSHVVALCDAARGAVRVVAAGWQGMALLGGSCDSPHAEEWVHEVGALFTGLSDTVGEQLRCSLAFSVHEKEGDDAGAGKEDPEKSAAGAMSSGVAKMLQQVAVCEQKVGPVDESAAAGGECRDCAGDQLRRTVKATTQLLTLTLAVKQQLAVHADAGAAGASVQEGELAPSEMMHLLEALDASLARCTADQRDPEPAVDMRYAYCWCICANVYDVVQSAGPCHCRHWRGGAHCDRGVLGAQRRAVRGAGRTLPEAYKRLVG